MKSILNFKVTSAIFLLLGMLVVVNSFGQDPKCPPFANGPQHNGGGSGNNGADGSTQLVGAHDPNQITGPVGFGVHRFVANVNPVNYNIDYENDGLAATAAAQMVKIVYNIGSHQNINSFQLGFFGFNSFTFQVPPNLFSYTALLNVVDSLGVYVQVTAGADVIHNQLFWIFQSIDPATGLPPTNPNVGFLPVRDTSGTNQSPNGIGFVTFSIKPQATDITGDTMQAQASIIFDINAPVPTNVEVHTIDAVAPTSHVIASAILNNTVTLFPNAVDDSGGCGVQCYDLFVAQDSSNFITYLSCNTASSVSFTGVSGSTYHFFSLATDNVGNREAMKTTPDTSITFGGIVPTIVLNDDSINAHYLNNCAGSTINIPYTITGTFNQDNIYTVQLSDSNGDFTIPDSLGSISSTASGIINVTLPSNTPAGNGYRIRIVSSDPVIISNPNENTITINANPVPIIIPNGPIAFCNGGSVILDAGTFFSYNWNTGATSQSITSNTTGGYSVTVTDVNGCVGGTSQNVTVNSNPTPIISPSGPTTFCDGGSVSLNAGSFSSYIWNTGATIESVTAFGSQPYCVTVTDGNGCFGTVCLNITVLSNPVPTITPNGPTTFCVGGSVTLSSGTFTNYIWSNGATTSSITATATGNYTVTVSNAQGCTGTSSQVVTVNVIPTPIITTNGSTNICSGGSLTLDAGLYSSYHWNTGATTETISVNNANTYKVTVTTAQGCTGNSAGLIVTVSPTITGLTITGATSVCTGANVNLSTGTTYNSYTWSTGATAQSIPIIATGTYYVTVSNGGNCTATAHHSVTFQVNPTPYIVSTNISNICGGGNANLTVNSTYSAYHWNTGGTTQGITINSGGTYTVTVLSTNGCSGTDSLTASSSCILPTSFAITNIAATGAMANWVEPGCYYGYTIRISKHNANVWTNHTITPNTHYMFSGLVHNTSYDWQIETICNASGTINSGFSATQTFSTLARFADGEIDSSFQALNVFPNPTNNLATVEFYCDKESIYNLQLTDVSGRIIINIDHNSVVGINQYEMDLSTLAKGIYLIILNNEEKVLNSKIVVQ